MLNMFTFMFMMAFLTFILTFSHILSTLLALEFMTLTLYLTLIFNAPSCYNDLFSTFLYLSVAVCEGALSLSLVVLLIRSKGNQLVKNIF